MRQIYITKLQMPSACRKPVRNQEHLTSQRTQLIRTADKEAGLAFEKKADIEMTKLNEPDDAANSLQEAFKVYRKTDPEDAARVIEVAINHYTSKGNFRRAATQKQNVAEVYEVEIGDQKRAIEAYELAASWFESDNAEA